MCVQGFVLPIRVVEALGRASNIACVVATPQLGDVTFDDSLTEVRNISISRLKKLAKNNELRITIEDEGSFVADGMDASTGENGQNETYHIAANRFKITLDESNFHPGKRGRLLAWLNELPKSPSAEWGIGQYQSLNNGFEKLKSALMPILEEITVKTQ